MGRPGQVVFQTVPRGDIQLLPLRYRSPRPGTDQGKGTEVVYRIFVGDGQKRDVR